jgi:hypothetical protein
MLIVRPDGYVGLATNERSSSVANAYLEAILGQKGSERVHGVG